MRASDNVEKTRRQFKDNILKITNAFVAAILIAECLKEDGGHAAEIAPLILMHICEALAPEALPRDVMDGVHTLSAWHGFSDVFSKMEIRGSLQLSTMGMFANTARCLSGAINTIYHSYNRP